MKYAKKIDGNIIEVKLPNAYNGVKNVLSGYESRTELHIQDGFLELIKPPLAVNQYYGATTRVNDTYVVEVKDYTVAEIEANLYNANKTLRIHEIQPNFNTSIDSVSNVSIESEKLYNEFSGLKEHTKYVNTLGDLVAIKHFELYEENGNKGTKLTIDFYDKNDEIGTTTETIDYYDDQRIKTFKGKCTIRVYERLLWDFDVEIGQLAYIVENYTDVQKQQVIQVMGLPSIEALNAMPALLTSLFDDLFKVQLKDQIDLMYKTGDSTELFNAISVLDYPPLDQQALTSEQAVKYTYRQILQAKFNPQNFNFYE